MTRISRLICSEPNSRRAALHQTKRKQDTGSLLDDDDLGKLSISSNAEEAAVPPKGQSKETPGAFDQKFLVNDDA